MISRPIALLLAAGVTLGPARATPTMSAATPPSAIAQGTIRYN